MHPLLLDLPAHIETERLNIRSYRAGDGAWYYPMSLRNQPHLARYEAGNPLMGIRSAEDAEVVVRQFAADWVARSAFFMACFLRESEAFVGQLYIGVPRWDLPECAIGYFADVDHTGCGYITEAVVAGVRFCFTNINAERIRLECDDTNLPSVRVAERCGFVREGHLRANRRWPDGSLSGTLVYGLLHSEWTI